MKTVSPDVRMAKLAALGLSYNDFVVLMDELKIMEKEKEKEYYAPGGLHDQEVRERQELEQRELERKKKFESVFFPILKEWIKNNLKPGMRIYLRGCRDGRGYREFMTFNDDVIEGRQIKRVNMFGKDEMGQITQHGFDKLVGVEINGKRVPIKELVNEKTTTNVDSFVEKDDPFKNYPMHDFKMSLIRSGMDCKIRNRDGKIYAEIFHKGKLDVAREIVKKYFSNGHMTSGGWGETSSATFRLNGDYHQDDF